MARGFATQLPLELTLKLDLCSSHEIHLRMDEAAAPQFGTCRRRRRFPEMQGRED